MSDEGSFRMWILKPNGQSKLGVAGSIEEAIRKYLGPGLYYRGSDDVAKNKVCRKCKQELPQIVSEPCPVDVWSNPVYNSDSKTEQETDGVIIYMIHTDADVVQHLDINLLATRIRIEQGHLIPVRPRLEPDITSLIERCSVHGPAM